MITNPLLINEYTGEEEPMGKCSCTYAITFVIYITPDIEDEHEDSHPTHEQQHLLGRTNVQAWRLFRRFLDPAFPPMDLDTLHAGLMEILGKEIVDKDLFFWSDGLDDFQDLEAHLIVPKFKRYLEKLVSHSFGSVTIYVGTKPHLF
jgi:hypothetical protein